jgi:hypothetical protein
VRFDCDFRFSAGKDWHCAEVKVPFREVSAEWQRRKQLEKCKIDKDQDGSGSGSFVVDESADEFTTHHFPKERFQNNYSLVHIRWFQTP